MSLSQIITFSYLYLLLDLWYTPYQIDRFELMNLFKSDFVLSK